MSKNLRVYDAKPKNMRVWDYKPKNQTINTDLINKVYDVTLGAGMYMGLPGFTYPTAITVQTPFSP